MQGEILKLNPSKMQIAVDSIAYFGYMLAAGSIKLSPEEVDAVKKLNTNLPSATH